MIGLAKFTAEHRKAIERDLLVRTGFNLDDVGRALPWSTFGAFLSHAEPDSALAAELHPELAEWSTVLKTNQILADIFDILAVIQATLAAKGGKKKPQKPKPYPRPWVEDKSRRHFGAGGLPPKELHAWFAGKWAAG